MMKYNKTPKIFIILIILLTITGCGAAIETQPGTSDTTTSGTAASDTAGTTSSDTTDIIASTTIDTTAAPTVLSTSPTTDTTGVALNSAVTATFSEAMDPLTITNSTFTLSDGSNNVVGTITYSDTTATFTPSSNLTINNTYTATITTEIKDVAGNIMTNNYTWSFKTVSAILSWSAPTERMDGSSLSAAEIGGYKVYYGTSSGNYNTPITVVNDITYTFNDLPAGIYFFAVKSFDTSATPYESSYSNEVSKVIQ